MSGEKRLSKDSPYAVALNRLVGHVNRLHSEPRLGWPARSVLSVKVNYLLSGALSASHSANDEERAIRGAFVGAWERHDFATAFGSALQWDERVAARSDMKMPLSDSYLDFIKAVSKPVTPGVGLQDQLRMALAKMNPDSAESLACMDLKALKEG